MESYFSTMASTTSTISPAQEGDEEYDTSTISPVQEGDEEYDMDVFDIYLLDDQPLEFDDNPYIQKLCDDSFLSILQRSRVENAFHNEQREKALFQLFLSPTLWDSMLVWTNKEFERKGKSVILLDKLMAYVGLEIGMSLVQIGSISSYWSTKPFSGHPDFGNTMSRTDFQRIGGSLQFHPPGYYYDVETATRDPLYHCRCFLNNFQKNCASIAVPLGASALDEASCRTSGQTKAKMYMPSKPMKYGIHFFMLL